MNKKNRTNNYNTYIDLFSDKYKIIHNDNTYIDLFKKKCQFLTTSA